MMRCTVLTFAALALFLSPYLFARISPSEWDFYCRRCHIERPVNSLYDPSIKAHSNTTLSCVTCHPNKGIAGHAGKTAESFRSMFQDLTLPPDIRYHRFTSVTNDECLRCHFYILEVDEIEKRKLPEAVRPIKLRAAHSQHWDYRTQTARQRDELKTLTAGKVTTPLTRTEQDQLDRLSQIETMQCSRCHERSKEDKPGGVDSNVNIAMKNPMECTNCHIALRTAIHPGYASSLPSAVSCEWCHHGNLHQKMTFFPVDRGTESDCLSCHPGYTEDELAALGPKQFIHKSTGSGISESGAKPDEERAITRKSGTVKPGKNSKNKYP
ncbi:MAG: hypothetical protein JXA73_04490 [Acidobacteria bacterium]|nr:hypothetical protein [Acidobacteriota bacterium]